MRSRILIGSGAWVVGVLTATGGSLYVSQQLGQGIFTANSALTTSQVQTNLAGESTEGASPSASASSSASPSASAAGSGSGSPSPQTSTSSSTAPSGSGPAGGAGSSPAPSPAYTSASVLFQTAGGSVYADCRPGGAYLEYWSAQDGYDAERITQGPASIATVAFLALSGRGGMVVYITCPNGTPQMTTQRLGGGGD